MTVVDKFDLHVHCIIRHTVMSNYLPISFFTGMIQTTQEFMVMLEWLVLL